MVNTQLLKLIEESDILEEDTQEITRIFEILTDNKKTEVINNWQNIALKIKESRAQLEKEKEILLTDTLADIQKDIEEYNKYMSAKKIKLTKQIL